MIRVDGDYDTAVAECRRQAEANGWTIISDTSWEGYESVPRSVMRGYCVLVHEAAVQQWGAAPTHVFVQAGVGGLAAAVIGYLWAVCEERPISIVVEPESADCWFQSNLAGKPTLASGDADTVMGEPRLPGDSALAEPADHRRGGRLVHDHRGGRRPAGPPPLRQSARPKDPAIISGPSGCAGLAGLMRVCTDDARLQGRRPRPDLARAAHQQRRQPGASRYLRKGDPGCFFPRRQRAAWHSLRRAFRQGRNRRMNV